MNQNVVSSQIKDPLLSMAYHIDFSDFLPFEEAVKSFCQLMEAVNSDNNSGELNGETANFIDKLAERILFFLQKDDILESEDKLKLMRSVQPKMTTSNKILGKKKNFQHLRFMLMTTMDAKHEDTFVSPAKSSPLEVFDVLLNTSDDLLSKRDVHLYKTKFVDKYSHDSSRLHHAYNFLNVLRQSAVSDFKREFIVEWIFESALINAILNEELIYTSITILKDAVRNFGMDASFMHGLLRALQKDYAILGKSTLQRGFDSTVKPLDDGGFASDALEQATSLVETIFPLLVTLTKENLSYVSKQIFGFTFDLTVPKEEYRLIKWNQWRWIRMLATHTWDASLREPPSWVISAGSLYCAIIFESAPPIWLQDYAYLLIERVYAETLVEGFMPTLQHYDYVEFLVRSLKKKSPYFASHADSYFALHLLSRLTPREANKETFVACERLNESNPVSQALGVLLNMTRI